MLNRDPSRTKYVGAVSDEIWETAKRRAYAEERNCFRPIVTVPNDSSIVLRKMAHASKGEEVRTFPATGSLVYYAPSTDNERLLEVKLVGSILFRDDQECVSRKWPPPA